MWFNKKRRLREDLKFYTDMYLTIQDIISPGNEQPFYIEMKPAFQEKVSNYLGLKIEVTLKNLMEADLL